MRRTAISIIAILALAATAQAADIVVNLGTITVPSAAVADGQASLETQVLYESVTTDLIRTDPETGEEYSTPVTERVEVVENDLQRIRRIAATAAKNAIRSGLQQFRQERADAAVQVEMDALPNPIVEE